jgi:hypothetical protein
MKTRGFLTCLLAAAALLNGVGRAVDANDGRDGLTDWSTLEAAYEEGLPTRNFASLRRNLRILFGDRDDQKRTTGLTWLGAHEKDFPLDQQKEFYDLYIQLNPGTQTSISLQNVMALKRLALASREERATIYATAISQGKVRVPGGDFLDRTNALGMAALDGIEELAPSLETYSGELNRARPSEEAYADILLSAIRLRAGAVNRADALNRHANRISALSDKELRRRMEDDPGFRGATLALARAACSQEITEPCRKLAELALRQEQWNMSGDREASEIRSLETGASDRDRRPSWLTRLSGITQGGQAANELERQEKRRQASERN